MKKFVVSESGEIMLTNPGEYLVELTKPNVEVSITGRWEAIGSDQAEVKLTIHHRAPRTVARTSLRGTSADQAKLTLTGRIIIDPECPQANSFLEERILLLSPNARGETVPELEILTDDVRCSHAASLSTIDQNQLFYLQSRGISDAQATQLLVDSFLEARPKLG